MRRLAATVLLLAGVILLVNVMASAESSMSRINRERMAIGRALLEMQSDNWPSLLGHYTDDIEYHDPIVDINGIDMMAQFLGGLFASSPDLVTTIEDEICINDMYAAAWTMVGSFNAVPYSAKGVTIIKFRPKSKMVYYQRDYYTEGDIMANIPGLAEPTLAFRTYYRCAVDPTFECPFVKAPAGAVSPGGATMEQDSAAPSRPTPGGIGPRSDMSNIDRERKRIGRALIEIQSANWTSLLQYYADDIEYSDPIVNIQGIDVMAPFLGGLFGSSPDLITTVEDEICTNGIYAAAWEMDGSFNGVPYTAKGMSIVKFRPGEVRAYYARDYYTEGDIMINIPGLAEPTEAFRTYYRCAVDPTFDCPFGQAAGEALTRANLGAAQDSELSAGFALRQNAPNPFALSTTISFQVPDGGGEVALRIYDASGRLVRTLVDGFEPSGTRSVSWDGRNDKGQPLANGVYFYQMKAPTFSESKKMFLFK